VTRSDRLVDDAVERLGTEIPELMAEHDIPGLALGICNRDGVVWSGGFGSTRRDGGRPVSTSTMFSVQSCSKTYTAALCMTAVERGLVDLDEPITAYLPEFTVHSAFERQPERRITMRHLLSHTAGFTHEAPEGSNYRIGSTSFDAHCRSIASTWLRSPVGHHYEYSNLGIDLAGWIVARVVGRPFPQVAREWLLEPLGLGRTTFDHRVVARDADRATGHDKEQRRLPVRIPMVAAGGVYTSVDDACRYVQMYLRDGEPCLSATSIAQMCEIAFAAPGQRVGYGLGVYQWPDADRTVYGHGGTGFGFLADLVWDPAAGHGVAFLTNSLDHPLQTTFATRLLRELSGHRRPRRPPPRRAPEVRVSARRLADLAGEYVGRGGESVRLTVRDRRLFLEDGTANRPARMTGEDSFDLDDDPGQRYRVLRDDAGDVVCLQNTDDGVTRMRNDAAALGRATVRRTRGFVATRNGARYARLTVRELAGGHALIDLDRWPTLSATRLGAGRYLSSTGEVLDLTVTPPTYANIPLRPGEAGREDERSAESGLAEVAGFEPARGDHPQPA
jgi:CubicO group peptidase (beta-lactamase class C family)